VRSKALKTKQVHFLMGDTKCELYYYSDVQHIYIYIYIYKYRLENWVVKKLLDLWCASMGLICMA